MKKLFFSAIAVLAFSTISFGQLMVAKTIGKDSDKYGFGTGSFAFMDFPLGAENRSIHLELEVAWFPQKGQGIFTASDGVVYGGLRAGYRYALSETGDGFYVIPSIGWGVVNIAMAYVEKAPSYQGVDVATEAGYGIPIGQNSQSINIGLKYEADINKVYKVQSIGLRASYSLNIFERR